MVIVRNWRNQDPYVGHISAIIWPLFRQVDMADPKPADMAQLRGMSGFVKHALQGRRTSDHHSHDTIEQMYYILKGRGQVLIGDEKRDVQEGDAIYLPVNLPHQAFNDGDDWMEHLIVSCPLRDVHQGTPAVRNWRNTPPVIGTHKAVVWDLLSPEGTGSPEEGAVLQRMHRVVRETVQGRRATTLHQVDGVEQVYYVVHGRGMVVSEGTTQGIMEGSGVFVPPGAPHQIVNDGDDWLEYVIFSAGV
ncbi:MAG: cupin domain-containing protein [Candidatus Latescibacteria bacterium]|nr:cupin domain-containing protein [Candidatus Latescibacterota bacterium]